MQGSYKGLVESNKDFIEMMNNLATKHESQKKEENARRISEMSSNNTTFRRSSQISITSSIVVRQSLSFVDSSHFRTVFIK